MEKTKVNFETYAIFDLETAGLPDLSFNKANITEFSVATISRKDLISKCSDLPRVINKLTLLFNPKMRIDIKAAEITGLDNFILENENSFDKNAGTTITSFLQHLKGPVCLVAHNGSRFDFPILKKAFNKIDINLPENVYCIDSLTALQNIDHQKTLIDKQEQQLVEDKHKLKEIIDQQITEIEKEQKIFNLQSKQDFKNNHVILLDQEEDYLTQIPESCFEDFYEIDFQLSGSKHFHINLQKENETTPKRKSKNIKQNSNIKQDIKQSRADILSNHGDILTQITPLSSNSYQLKTNENRVKRELFTSNPRNSAFKKNIRIPRSPKGYYTLGGIYKRIFNCDPKLSHHAGGDVDMLQRIINHYGQDFINFSEENSIPFSEIKIVKS